MAEAATLLDTEVPITETWANELVTPDGLRWRGTMRWPNEASAKSQADTIHLVDMVLSEVGRRHFGFDHRIEQVKL
jgi:hypothetical protein